ncbi:MAG: DUF4349 domain-containing protein [Bacteroidota bacterium]
MRFSYFIFFLLLTIACESSFSEEAYSDTNAKLEANGYAKAAEYEDTETDEQQTFSATSKLKIIKTADLRMQVKDVTKSSSNIEGIVKNHQAYISNSSLNNSTYRIENDITIRVPSNRFDEILEALTKEAIFINYKNIGTQDVSEEYFDIEARLKTKKEVLARYEEILRTKAKTVKDVLAAENAIRKIQEEIESKEGRLRYLKDRVGLSTINLSIYQEVEYQDQPEVVKDSYFSKMTRAGKRGGFIISELFLGLISIWPILLILSVLYWQRKRIFGRKKKENS